MSDYTLLIKEDELVPNTPLPAKDSTGKRVLVTYDETSGQVFPYERPSIGSDIKEEATEGLRQVFNPEGLTESDAETLGITNPIAKAGVSGLMTLGNILGGAGRAAFSLTGGAGRNLIERPLEEAGHPTLGKVLNLGAQVLTTGPRAVAQVSKIPKAGKIAAKLIDPLSDVGKVSLANKLEAQQTDRANRVAEAGKLRGAEEDTLKTLENLAPEATQIELRKLGALEQSVPDVAPPRLENFPDKLVENAPSRSSVGSKFKTQIIPHQAKEMFAKSSENYENVLRSFGDTPIAPEDLAPVTEAIENLVAQKRGTSATRSVAEDLPSIANKETLNKWMNEQGDQFFRNIPTEAVEQIAQRGKISSDEMMEIIAQNLGGGDITVGKLVRMRQILREHSRAAARSGNISARNADKQIEGVLSGILSEHGGEASEVLGAADEFHKQVHELIGPRSLAQKVFKKEPENVVDSIFLPEGSAPNLSSVRRAKSIYMQEDPGAWQDLAHSALERFQSRSINLDSGTLDPQKLHRNWARYRETFKEALEPDQFQVIDSVDKMVRQFNIQNKEFRDVQRLVSQVSKQKQVVEDVRRFGDRAIARQQKRVDRAKLAEHQAGQLNPTSKQPISEYANPYLFMALAQVGQAFQATLTGNWGAASRQLAQGVIWYTLGNPYWLTKVVQDPNLAKAMKVVSEVQKAGKVTAKQARYIEIMERALEDELESTTGPSEEIQVK